MAIFQGNLNIQDAVVLGDGARIKGEISYQRLEMALGAEVEGKLIKSPSVASLPRVQSTHVSSPKAKISRFLPELVKKRLN